MPKQQDERICVGAIAGAYGVKGAVRLKSFCATPSAIAGYAPLTDKAGKRIFSLALTAPLKNGFIAQIQGVTSKEQAEALRGTRLFAPRTVLPNLPDDEFYHADLIGLQVFDTGGTALGHITDVQNHGAGDLLEVTSPALKTPVLKTPVLLPFTRTNVPTVDLTTGRVIVDPPEGIFPE